MSEVAQYFRKLAEESIHWHITTDSNLAWAAHTALEALAMYEEGHICEVCGDVGEDITGSECYNCSPEGREQYALDREAECRED